VRKEEVVYVNVRCSIHPLQSLETRLVSGPDGKDVALVVTPCPECHAINEWSGYQDGLNDRPAPKGPRPNGEPA
jgi:hypothetical protein